MLVSVAIALSAPALGTTPAGTGTVDTGTVDTAASTDTGVPPETTDTSVDPTTDTETDPDTSAETDVPTLTATSLAGETGGVHCASVDAIPAGWLAVLLLAGVRRARESS